MIKYSEVIGLPAISFDNGKNLGIVKDIIFCPKNKEIKAFLLERRNYEFHKRLVLYRDTVNLGRDALIVRSDSALKRLNDIESSGEIKDKGEVLGLKVYTKSGEDLGTVKDVLIDYKNGLIEGVEVSDGLLQDIVKGRNIVPLFGKVEFSEDNILVGREALDEIESTGGGLRKRLLGE